MARITKSMDERHKEALKRFDEIQTVYKDERTQCLQDRRFYSVPGAQWEGNLSDIYENKPKFEVNKVHLAVIRIFNEYRNNRITVNFLPKDGSSQKLAETCNGLFRADEQDSVAEEAYDNAFEEGVGGGIGAWRLRAEYEDEGDEENERQRIKIEPIYDADSSVFFDPMSKRQDKSDARYCFVVYPMSPAAYKDKYGDDPVSWPKSVDQSEFDWATPDAVYVAEYYEVREVTKTVRIFEDITGNEERHYDDEFEDDPELAERLEAMGTIEIRSRKIKEKQVHKDLLSGGGIIEDCGLIAGKCIPIIPSYGKRWVVDGVERCMGHVRLSKDSQRLKNMQISKLGEIAALSSVEKPFFTPEQMAGHQTMWAQDNIKDYPYLLLNPITGPDGSQTATGPLGYTKPPSIPPAMAALLQITEQDMQEILGSSQQADKMVSNISGKAVEMIQQRLDMQTFIYMSNFAKAMKRCGEVWLSMAKDLYVEEGRVMKIITDGEENDSVELMRPVIDENTGSVILENDLSTAKFDVIVDVGPSSSSKRASTVRALTGMMAITQDPETLQVLGAMSIMNMEGDGIDDARNFFRKRLIKMGVVKPTDKEMEQLQAESQNAPQDPNAVFMEAAAEEAQAKAAKARADTVKTIADAELSQAKTAETYANIERGPGEVVQEVAEQPDPPEPEESQFTAQLQAIMDKLQSFEVEEVSTVEQPENNEVLDMIAELSRKVDSLASEPKEPKETQPNIAEVINALAEMQRCTPAPVTNVIVEKGGSVKKEMKIQTPSGEVYKGEVTEGDDND